MMKNVLFMCLAVIVSLCSCSQNEEDASSASDNSLFLKFKTQSISRAIEDPGTPGDAAKSIKSARILFYADENYQTMSVYNNSQPLVLSSDQINSAVGSDGLYIDDIPNDVKAIIIQANGGEDMDGNNVNLYQVEPLSDQDFHQFPMLEGRSTIVDTKQTHTITGHKIFKASVTVSPSLCRIEISGGINVLPKFYRSAEILKDKDGNQLYEHRKSDGSYYNSTSSQLQTDDDATYNPTPAYNCLQKGFYGIKLEAIYMNNVILKYGDLSSKVWYNDEDGKWNTHFDEGGELANMWDNVSSSTEACGDAVAQGSSGDWWVDQAIPANRNSSILSGKVVAYQVFPQKSEGTTKDEIAQDMPHVIVKVKIFETKADYDSNSPRTAFLNIRTYISSDGSYIKEMKNGNIYKINLNELSNYFNEVIIDDTPITPTPETDKPDPLFEETIDLKIYIDVTPWELMTITPQI